MSSATHEFLKESTSVVKKTTGVDMTTPSGVKRVLNDRGMFNIYAEALSEGLEGEDKSNFIQLAKNTQKFIVENSMFQLNAYETLSMPVLRVFYPKLISKELVNVMPIDKPEVVKGFIRASFETHADSAGSYPYAFPSTAKDISKGPGVTVAAPGTASVPGTENLFSEIPGGGLTSANAHIDKDFKIVAVTDSTGFEETVEIIPDVDGNFSQSVTFSDTALTDVLQGHVNWETGVLQLSSIAGTIITASYQAYASLEENQINPTTRFEVDKIPFSAIDRRISAEWTINMEQDARALFDLSVQAEMVNIIGEQIAIDIDRETITALITANSASNPASHIGTFDKNPPATFTWGRKLWYENIIPTMNQLSAQVYNSCLMGSANTLACNPLDAAILESFNTFEYKGDSVDGGDVGYRSATVQGGKWKVLVSSVVPSGSIILKYRSNDLMRASYVYAPYVPALLTPYPLGPIPSLTVLVRYAKKMIRPEALAVLTVSDTA